MKLLFQLATYRASNQLPLAGLQSTRRQTDHRFDKVSIKCAVVEWGGGCRVALDMASDSLPSFTQDNILIPSPEKKNSGFAHGSMIPFIASDYVRLFHWNTHTRLQGRAFWEQYYR